MSKSSRMREEWDRRIRHDYRFWMSDGIEDDATMWRTGERDLDILCGGPSSYEANQSSVALELGCGVGRILRATSFRFGKVIGVDVSQEAVERARGFLADRPNVSVLLGNGEDLAGVATSSVDFAYTFAALSSMPVDVIAAYLSELGRIVRPGGTIRLQVYVGSPQDTVADDSIAIRSFAQEAFSAALAASGFDVENYFEFTLPFEISDPEAGLNARIVSARRSDRQTAPRENVQLLLLPEGEAKADGEWPGSRVEYWMALTRARTHLDAGELEPAAKALEFATAHYREADKDVVDLLNEIRRDLQARQSTAACAEPVDLLGKNLKALEARFPEVANIVRGALAQSGDSTGELSISMTADGEPIISAPGLPLDHAERPRRAAEVWAGRTLNDQRFNEAQKVVCVGLGAGYHLESLLERRSQGVFLFEPRPEVLAAAVKIRDLSQLFSRLEGLVCGNEMLARSSDILSGAYLVLHPQTAIYSREGVDQIKRTISRKENLRSLRPSIAVVGPIYGGSLPIAGYVADALKQMGQRVHYYDLSKFVTAYRALDEMVKTPQRINALQGYYVEMLSQIVLEGITERPVDMVICLAQAPLSPRVLSELRNRGIITAMWFVEDCRRFSTWRDIARYYDYMFIIQQGEILREVEAAGAGKCVYLPMACDPNFHRPLEVSAEERARWGSQVSFLGAGYNNRQQMFAHLARMDFKIWGTEWPFGAPFDKLVQEKGRRIDPSEYIKIFNSSAINLNLHSSMERDGVEPFGDFVNPRTFELASCGAFQLADNRLLLPELFEVGKEIITFDDQTELEEKIEYYLAHPEERIEVANRARARVLKDHTYVQRMEVLLNTIYADRGEEIRARTKNSPWEKTFQRSEAHSELNEKFRKVYERGNEPKLEELVADIQLGKGALTRTEHQLLFLHHVKTQISYVHKLRATGQ